MSFILPFGNTKPIRTGLSGRERDYMHGCAMWQLRNKL